MILSSIIFYSMKVASIVCKNQFFLTFRRTCLNMKKFIIQNSSNISQPLKSLNSICTKKQKNYGHIRRPPLSFPAFQHCTVASPILYPLHMGSNLCVWSRTVCILINCFFSRWAQIIQQLINVNWMKEINILFYSIKVWEFVFFIFAQNRLTVNGWPPTKILIQIMLEKLTFIINVVF